MSESWVEKAVEKMYNSLRPKRVAASRYFRRYLRKNKIRRIYERTK